MVWLSPLWIGGASVITRLECEARANIRRQIQTGSICSGTGNTRVCTPTYTTIWHTGHHPDRWYITLEACEIEGTRQHCRSQERQVDHGTFDNVAVGDFVSITKPEADSQ